MKQVYYLLLVTLMIFNNSCTMVLKGLGKSAARHYDDKTEVNLANLKLRDQTGNEEAFSKLFSEKAVYMYIWNKNLPPDDRDTNYLELKKRFSKYNDVVFINVYTGTDDGQWEKALNLKNTPVKSYLLTSSPENNTLRILTDSVGAPQIIGKNGALLGFRGPTPNDHLVVDYALYQARTGENATKSTRTLIKGINSRVKFKNPELATWYKEHFQKKPEERLRISITSNN